jgi:hypothetical protein
MKSANRKISAGAGWLLVAMVAADAEARNPTYCDQHGRAFSQNSPGYSSFTTTTIIFTPSPVPITVTIPISVAEAFDSYQSSFPGASFGDFLASEGLVPCEAANAAQQASVRNFATAIYNNIQFQILQSVLNGGGSGSGDAPDRAWNTWATPTFTSIESQLGLGGKESTNSYQLTFGGDTRIGSFILGASGAYTRIDAEIANGADDYRLAPYLAYSFNRNMYATAIVGYNRKRVDSSSLDGNGLFTDASLNYILPVLDNAALVGRVGHRFGYFAQEGLPSPGFKHDDDAWDNTYYLSAEALYKWGNFLPFLNVTWEHFDPEDLKSDMDSALLKAGVQYAVRNDVTLGLTYQTELTGRAEDQDVYYNQAGMDLRIRF